MRFPHYKLSFFLPLLVVVWMVVHGLIDLWLLRSNPMVWPAIRLHLLLDLHALTHDLRGPLLNVRGYAGEQEGGKSVYRFMDNGVGIARGEGTRRKFSSFSNGWIRPGGPVWDWG